LLKKGKNMNKDLGNNTEGSYDYSEDLASWAVRFIHPTGFQCILTIQAGTGAEALKKAESALSHLVEAKCTPIRKEAHNGNERDNGHRSGKTTLVKSDGNDKTVICPLHNVQMQKWSKNGRSWYAHRWEDGWCHGK